MILKKITNLKDQTWEVIRWIWLISSCLTFAKTWIWWVSSTPFEFFPHKALNSYPFFTKPRPCIIQVSKCPLLRTYPNKNAQTDRHATLSEKWARQIGNWDSIRVSYLPILYTRCLMVSTDQADPSCFYLRISWILHELCRASKVTS